MNGVDESSKVNNALSRPSRERDVSIVRKMNVCQIKSQKISQS